MKATQQRILIIVAGVVLMGPAGWWFMMHRMAQGAPEARTTASKVTGVPDLPDTAAPTGQTASAAKNTPLPPLLPGSQLDDERFAAVSAKFVIAAIGLKQDSNWQKNVTHYMSKTLKEAGISEDEYTEYAEALNAQPDRGRAVAQNIIRKAETVLGRKITVEKLPMYKFNQSVSKQAERKLKQ